MISAAAHNRVRLAADFVAFRITTVCFKQIYTDHTFMVLFDKTLRAWNSPEFMAILKQEIENMDPELLPLQQGLTTGNYAIANNLTAMINNVLETSNLLCVTAGIFYTSVIAGCSCADDPTPINENNEYCIVRLDIDKDTAVTEVNFVT